MNFCSVPLPPKVCYVFRPSHPFVLDHTNNIEWIVQIMKCLCKFLGSDSGCRSKMAFCAFTWPRMMFQGNIVPSFLGWLNLASMDVEVTGKRKCVDLIAGWKIWSAKSLKFLYVISTVSNLITSTSTKIKFGHPEEKAASYYETSEGMCHPTQRNQQDWHMKLLDV